MKEPKIRAVLLWLVIFFSPFSFYPVCNVLSRLKGHQEWENEQQGRPKEHTLKTFTELLIISGSDKYFSHHYENYYEKWLNPFRHTERLTLLEIGAFKGSSLRLWDSYFTKAELIVGLSYGIGSDVVMNRTQFLSRVKIVKGDQSSTETMERLKLDGPFDIIIDDGSHMPSHMVFSLFSLWNSVRPGGLYIIEDLELNYWKKNTKRLDNYLVSTGIGASPMHSAVSKLEQIQQVLIRHQIGARNLTVMPGDSDLCSVEWGMNLVKLYKCELNITKPAFKRPRYDKTEMQAWIEASIKSNPNLNFDVKIPESGT